MENEKVAKRIQEKRKKVELHNRMNKKRKEAADTIKSAYLADKDGLVLSDVLAKARGFVAYHVKLAQDGTGARRTGFKLEDGTAEVENYFLSSSERVTHLDKSAGLLEIIDYIERQLTIPVVEPEQKEAPSETVDPTTAE